MLEFSIVIPVFNAESTLDKAVQSVIKQTYAYWELIIVDDCSTDGSYAKAMRYAEQDSRIRTIRMSQNSGSAKMPRDKGVELAQNEYCLYVDSDDEISSDYLQKMSEALLRHDVQSVVPTMVVKNKGQGDALRRLPSDTELLQKVFSGKEACRLTLPHWTIGCAGMVFRKDLYLKANEKNKCYYMYSDEFNERLMLYYSSLVYLSDAEYIYWQHAASITHKKSIKLYDRLCVDRQLVEFAIEHYDRELVVKVFCDMLSHLMVMQKDFYRDKALYSDEEKTIIRKILDDAFAFLKKNSYIEKSTKEKVLLSNAILFRLICRAKL